MTEPVAPEIAHSDDVPPKTRIARRVFGWIVGAVLGLLLFLAALRFFVPTIPPEQEAPEPHFGEPCVLCHLVVEGAEEVEVE